MNRRLLVIRHCRSTGQWPDAPLTAEGRLDAAALGILLDRLEVDAVFSSPYLRAQQTVSPYAHRKGIEIVLDGRLAERRLAAEDPSDWLDCVRRSFDDPDYRAAGGESLNDAQRRGLAAIGDIAGSEHRLPAVATHGNLLAAILLSADPRFGFDEWLGLGNPDLFELRFDAGRLVGFRRLAERVA